MSIAQRIGVIILLWFGFSVILIGMLTSKRSKKKTANWSKKDKELMFSNARILCLLLAVAIGLLL